MLAHGEAQDASNKIKTSGQKEQQQSDEVVSSDLIIYAAGTKASPWELPGTRSY